jgi:hypothetical protein
MDMETYEEVIDAYNLSSEKRRGMSLTDYIKINNIKIKEIEMSPLEDLKKVAKKADGGIMRKAYAGGSSLKDMYQSAAEEIADEDYGQEFYDLSDKLQDRVYRKAMQRINDGLLDRADSMRKNEADGGFMRQGYAMGTDEDDIPEAEDIPMDEYMELLKSLGAPVKGQESGIRTLKSPMQTASDDANDRLMEKIYEDLLDEGFSPEEAARKAREMFDQMANRTASVDEMLLEEYLKYVDEMKEMGREPMSLRQFSEQARAGLKVGGLASII